MVINKKYDIFISYRHNNMTLVGELVHRLERYYDVFWDQRLESGYWSEQLTRAIDNSRAVLINLTLNSLNKNQNGEDWFYKEIVYSMEHKAKEEIIPVCYDGFVFPENLAVEGITDKEKEKLSILRDDHQRITDLKTLDGIIVKIISYLSAIGVEPKEEFSASKKEYSLKFESLSPVQSFIGREAEISETIKLVNENDMVFLYGIGGIGKTELAKKIMEEMTGEYRCIFCKYESSLKNTLSKIEITGLDTEDFNVKERILHKLLNKNVILVIDNFDFSADKDIDNYIHELCKYSCKKLITTRNSFREIEFPCKTDFIPLGSLSFSDLKALFEKKYGKEITEGQFEKILSFTGGLTLAVPILASLCLKSEITIDELCEKLASGIRGLENTESVRYMKDGNKKGNVPEILRILFDMDKISESKKNTLRNLSILQFMPVTKRLYKEIACSDGKGNLDDFNELAEDGWIKEVFVSENGVSYYELHPLINALVKEDLEASFATCPDIFRTLFEKSDILFKKSSESILIALISSLDLRNKSNYNYLALHEKSILKSGHTSGKEIYSSATLYAVRKTVKEILLSKNNFEEDDVIIAAGLMGIKEVADDMKLVSYLAYKCFDSAEKKLVSAETIKLFTRRFIHSAKYEMNLLSSNRAKAYETYSRYERECAKYLTIIESLSLRKSFHNIKDFLDTKVQKYGDIYKCAEEARNAKNIEKSFELAESFWRIMDIEEFFRENVFMVYLKENATEEETQNVLDATIKRYGDRDMSDEYGIDYRFEIIAAFMQSYVTRGLKHLSYEQCFELIKHLNPYPNNEYPRYWILAAKIMCGDDEAIERELYELMSKEETVKKSVEDAKAAFYTIDSAISRYSGIHALDRYAEDIFFYLDELKELSREKPDYANAFYTAHLYSKEWFKSFEYSEKARKKCEEYKLYAQSLGLMLSEE